MTRGFCFVLLAVSLLLAGAAFTYEPHRFTAHILIALAFGIMLSFAIVVAFEPAAKRVDLLRDPRVIEAERDVR